MSKYLNNPKQKEGLEKAVENLRLDVYTLTESVNLLLDILESDEESVEYIDLSYAM